MSGFGRKFQKNEGQSDRRFGLPFFFIVMIFNFSVAGLILSDCLDVLGSGVTGEKDNEFRGIWVIRHTLTTPKRVLKAVERCREVGFNALFVQVRGRGDAYYKSRIVPRGEDILEEFPDFDPLALAIQEAHRTGLEIHAWVNVYLAWHPTERLPKSSNHLLVRHPEWFMVSKDGINMGRVDMSGKNSLSRGVEGRYLSPGIQEVREHLLKVILELVQGYDLDGLHLDYIRYPNVNYDFNLINRAEFTRRFGFDPQTLVGKTNEQGGLSREKKKKLWEQWRTDQVSLQVSEIQQLLLNTKPWIKLSVAVKPNFELAYREFGQDWIKWINKQMVDFVVPMLYLGTTEEIGVQIQQIQKYVRKGHLYAGIGGFNQSPSATEDQINQARRMGLKGIMFFSYDSLNKQPKLLKRLQTGLFRGPLADIPIMRWKRVRNGEKSKNR